MGVKLECLVDRTNHKIILKEKVSEGGHLDLVWEEIFSKNAFSMINHKPEILRAIEQPIIKHDNEALSLEIACAGEKGLRTALSVISMAFKVPRISLNNCTNPTMLEFDFDEKYLIAQQLLESPQSPSIISESPPNYHKDLSQKVVKSNNGDDASMAFGFSMHKRKISQSALDDVEKTDPATVQNKKR